MSNNYLKIHWLKTYHWKSTSVSIDQLKTRINTIKLMQKIFHTLYNTIHFYKKNGTPGSLMVMCYLGS